LGAGAWEMFEVQYERGQTAVGWRITKCGQKPLVLKGTALDGGFATGVNLHEDGDAVKKPSVPTLQRGSAG